jgi:lysophospholipase L1-like esterase
MDWYEPDVRQLERRAAKRNGPSLPVVFYGSSTIRLWETLSQDLGDPRALNIGFGGSTLEACSYFFRRLVLPLRPSSLVVYAGDNDLGDGHSPDDVAEYFRSLSAQVSSELGQIAMAYVSIKPSPARIDLLGNIRQANRLIQELILQRSESYYVNVFDSMLTPDGAPRTDLFSDDGLHMNRAGYRLWTELFLPFRNRMFTVPSSSIQSRPLS